MKSIRFIALMLATVLVGVWYLVAQRVPGAGQMRGQAGERVEQFKKIRLMEILSLDEQSSIRFFARYNKHQESMRDIRMKQAGLFQQIQALRRSGATDAEYDKVLSDLRALQNQTHEAREKYMNEISEVLSKKQLAEYIVFEVRFELNLREILREIQKEREDRLK